MTSRITTFLVSSLLAYLASSTPAYSQGFNVDFDSGPVVATSSSYGAAGTPGVWNQLRINQGQTYSLTQKSGAPSSVTLDRSVDLSEELYVFNSAITGDHGSLMHDIFWPWSPTSIKMEGLINGLYDVYTYALAPDNPSYVTNIAVTGSTDPTQPVGGSPWTGSHVQGNSYALHRVLVVDGTIEISLIPGFEWKSCNGLQIEPVQDPGAAYCFGDGTGVNCPCSGFSISGEGCMTSSGSGAKLVGVGTASLQLDDFHLVVTGAPSFTPGLIFQGANSLSTPLGDGILCSNSNLRYSVNPTDIDGMVYQVGLREHALPGQTLNYQYWFRDSPNPCGNGFNFSNGWTVSW